MTKDPPHQHSQECLAFIYTRNYTAYAKALVKSFKAHHPGIDAVGLLIDANIINDFAIPEATIYTIDEISLNIELSALTRYNASEFSNAVKPNFLMFLSRFYESCIYLDTDIYIYAPLTSLLTMLDSHPIVLTPHTFQPYGTPELEWRYPRNSDIFNSGLFNAGCFGIKLKLAFTFLALWSDLNFSSSAFNKTNGWQTDQQFLNWSITSDINVGILRDRAYNVAYWNLHERSLRSGILDGLEGSWQVNGLPLVCYHFSGFDPIHPADLSRHQNRYSLYNLPSVSILLNNYRDCIISLGHLEYQTLPYGLDIMGNGIELVQLLRDFSKVYWRHFTGLDVRIPADADEFCRRLMSNIPHTGSRLPAIAAYIYDLRSDLQTAFPSSHSNPTNLQAWFAAHAGEEYGIDALIARFRMILRTDAFIGFGQQLDVIFSRHELVLDYVYAQRNDAIDILRSFGYVAQANQLAEASSETWYTSSLSSIHNIYNNRPDLMEDYPYIYGRDHGPFLNWLNNHGASEAAIPVSAIEAFGRNTWSLIFARIYSIIARLPNLEDALFDGLLTSDLSEFERQLTRLSGDGLEFSLSDVEAFFFIISREKHLLVYFILGLPRILYAPIHPAVNDSFTKLIAHLNLPIPAMLHGQALYRSEVSLYEAYLHEEVELIVENERVRHTNVVHQYESRVLGGSGSAKETFDLARTRTLTRMRKEKISTARNSVTDDKDFTSGLNIFGPFLSETGVGQSARGLFRATKIVRPVSSSVTFGGHLREGTHIQDVRFLYKYGFDTNVFVTYPHEHKDILNSLPRRYTRGRRNIAHLAWEQRDWHPIWTDVYSRYDNIWVISEFASQPFRHLFGDRVVVVPNVVNIEGIAINPDHHNEKFSFLFVCDANSSLIRKDPFAIIQAYRLAFENTALQGDVALTLRVSNMDRIDHDAYVTRLRQAAQETPLMVEFNSQPLSRLEVLRLIAKSDAYVSLHRSEGFGYTMAEAMALGKPVIATGYSGNLQYMNSRNSFLVETIEEQVGIGDGPFEMGSIWGRPSIQHAAELMRIVASGGAGVLSVAEKGKIDVETSLSELAVAQIIERALSR